MFQFLNQSMIWLLALVLIPIIIHLFNFKRRKKVFFTNLWFLKSVQNKTKSYSNLKKLIVLALRVLFIVWLVISVLNPIFNTENTPKPKSEAIYIDNSQSLSNQDAAGQPLFDLALDYMSLKLKDQSPSVLTNERIYNHIEGLEEKITISGFGNDLAKTREQIIDRFTSSLWISDFQKNDDSLDKFLNDSSHLYQFVIIEQATLSNMYVDTVYMEKPLGYGASNSIVIEVQNIGAAPEGDQTLKVEKDGRQLAAMSFTIGSNDTQQLTLDISENENLSGSYTLTIEDSQMEFDNIFYFQIQDIRQTKVLIVSGKKTNKFIRSAVGNEDIFNTTYKTVNDVSSEDLIKSQFVILDDIKSIPQWLAGQLQSYSGTILIFPGSDIDLSTYSLLLSSSISEIENPPSYSLSASSLNHPLYLGLFDQLSNITMPSAKKKFEIGNTRYNKLLTLNDGSGFLMQKDNMFFVTTILNKEYTDLMDHALFIPTIYSISQQSLNNAQLYHRIDQRVAQFPWANAQTESLISLTNNSENYILNSRYAANKLTIEIPADLSEPGFYSLQNDKDTIRTLAFNFSKKESYNSFYDEEELKDKFAGMTNISIVSISSKADIDQIKSENEQGTPLWKYALILALTFLVAEMLVLRLMK